MNTILKSSKKEPFLRSILMIFFITAGGCFSKNKKHNPPQFDADYSFEQILQYERFGSKVPGTPAHQQAGDWIVNEMKKFTSHIHEQKADIKNFQGKTIPMRNIIAQFNPNAKTRFLLSAHWDNRPFADQDLKNNKLPVPGVNDGGSGVVVLMAIAKAVSPLYQSNEPPEFGLDFAFWDAEDWGNPSQADTYCLGSQYFAKNPVPENYKAKFGINFDMVGRKGSVFPIEINSERYAPELIQGIRAAAKKLGYEDHFPTYRIGPITDDHVYISEKLNIPMMDLIYMTPTGLFPPEWHTLQDTSEHISRDVLKVVGQTTLQLLFSP